jgi:hypothetical protein
MSKKTRFIATTLALTLLAGTVTFAAPAPGRSRSLELESQSFLVEAVAWIRELLEGRRGEKESGRATEPSSSQKDGSCADPNGLPCRK